MSALARSRITVSCWPDVTPEPAAPGSRGVGSVSVPTRATCPGPCTGATGVWPLFQLASVDQSPLLSLHQTAGTSWSFKNSTPPLATFMSRLLPPLLKLWSRPVLAYCQNFQGCAEFGASSQGP